MKPSNDRKYVKARTEITCLFVDVGGVLLTDGWDHNSRKRAGIHFGFDADEVEGRHRSCFATYEEGKMTMDEYLARVVFTEPRSFSQAQFRDFIFAQTKPFPQMIELVSEIKKRLDLKVVVVSNEARELNAHRIKEFGLDRFVDIFISSCFVHLRKPDSEIFRLALDIAQVSAEKVLYIENTALFVSVAESMGIQGILHMDYETTREQLAHFGLECPELVGAGRR
jgi:putative hydrolase of the HAD superfamily